MKKYLSVELGEERHQKLKIYAIKKKKYISDLVKEWIDGLEE